MPQNPNPTFITPGMAGLLSILKHDIFASLNCHRLGKVESVDYALNTITASISSKWTKDDGTVVDYPLLVDVPFMVLTGGAAHITLPIQKGDDCLLLFNDRDIDNWFVGNTTAPNTRRLHSLADGLAIIGFRPKSNPVADLPRDCIMLRYGSCFIKIFTNKVELTDGTNSIILTAGGDISISAPTKLNISAPNVEISGVLKVGGDANISGISFKGHIHGGVQGGGSTTGGPQ